MDEKPFYLEFSVPISPVGLERPRMTTRGIHTPKKSRKAKADILLFAKSALRKAKLRATSKPVAVVIGCRFTPHKNWPVEQKKKAIDRRWMTFVPDMDNIVKLVLDAISKHAYKDDRQVALILAAKVYSETYGVDVVVCEIGANVGLTAVLGKIGLGRIE